MPALSKKQQKFMGIVRSIQKGEQPASKFNKDAQDAAKDMRKSSVKKFAGTKHKGLPTKVKKEILKRLKEMIRQELSEYTYGVGDVVKDDNPTCPHYGAMGKVKSVNPRSVVFVVTNKGDNFKPGQELEKSHDQMKKMKESVNESYTLYHNGRPVAGFYTNALPITKVVGTSTSSYISFPSEKSIKDEFKRVLSDVSKDDRFTKQDVQKLATMFKRMKIRKNESVNENKVYKVGDTVSLLSFDRRHRGRAKVKGVTKSRPNKFGIKNHYITNKGTFTDMEVEGTEAFKLRFKGDTEKKVTKAMNSPYGVVLPEQSVKLNEMNYKGFVKYMNDFYGPKGLYPDKKKRTLKPKDINMAYSILLKQKPNFEIGFDSTDREMIRDILIKQRKLDPDYNKGQLTKDRNVKEAVNEMSAKSKKIINKLNKKEKEMFMDMIDIMGFDQVMADYKRDKKAFKQALKDMSEGVIQEKFSVKSTKDYVDNLDTAINLIIRQAQNLKGALAKHPIKRNLNKLKAIQTLLKRAFAPELYAYEREYRVKNTYKAVDMTTLKKRLQDGKFKAAIEYSLLPALDTRSYDSNSFYYLKDGSKGDKLRKRLVDVLYDLRNKMDKAQLENINEDTYIGHYKNKKVKINAKSDKEAHKQIISKLKVPKKDYDIASIQNLTKKTKTIGDKLYVDSVNEDGHTDVASSKRKVMIMVDDSNKLLNKLNGMNKEDSLPSWWSDKITLSQNYLAKAKDYLLNPVESVNEARLDPKQTLQQLGGNRFIAMTGAKNLAVDKSKNELHMKIMRNAKGISHVRIRLTSMDLYDMEFLQVRAGRIKIKSKEKGVYGDQLGKMFKKNTGLNVRL